MLKSTHNITRTMYWNQYFVKKFLSYMETREIKCFFIKTKQHLTFQSQQSIFLENLKTETGINYIPYSHIPVKSPDAAPMDFCVFGALKHSLGKRRPKTLGGLWKVLNEEWNNLNDVILQKSLVFWKIRCRAIVERKGYQIEHLRKNKYGLK